MPHFVSSVTVLGLVDGAPRRAAVLYCYGAYYWFRDFIFTVLGLVGGAPGRETPDRRSISIVASVLQR